MPDVLLVRHCESSGQAPDAPLTATGRQQARELAAALAGQPVDFIVSSPFLRARETIRPFARRCGLRVASDPRLRERELSAAPVDDWREYVARSFSEPQLRLPGGESGSETLARGWAALHDVMRSGHRLPLVVSHGQLLALILHSLDPGFGFRGWQALRNPNVYRLRGSPGRLRAERWSPRRGTAS